MSQLNERGANSERNSALWGTGGRGGDRSSVLWGKGGRGMLVATMVVALAAPLAATASPGKKPVPAPAPAPAPAPTVAADPVAPSGGPANSPDGKTWVAKGLMDKAKNNPNDRVSVIIQSADGVSGADNAFKWLAKLANKSNQDGDFTGNNQHSLDLIGGISVSVPAKWLDKLQQVPGLTITPNALIRLQGSTASTASLASSQLWPYESGNSQLWAGDMALYQGKTPAIAIVDSGVQSRSDFGNRIVTSVNLSHLTDNPNDERGHGTFVAGIAAGAASDLAGAAPAAPIVSVKVLNKDGQALTSDIIDACQWILDNKEQYNIRVANFSLHSSYGTNFYRDPLDRAVEKLWFSGVVVVAAAGNYGLATGPSGVKYSPGNDPFVITVGAVDLGNSARPNDDTVPSWSAYGYTYDGFYKPEVAAPGRYMVGPIAPGAAITSLKPGNMVGTDRIQLSGTSFAAPVVSGTVAQMLARHPNWTPDQVKGALMRTARKVSKNPKAAGLGEITASRAAISGMTPNPNAGLDRYLTTPAGSSSPVFDSMSWASAAKASMSWNSMSWSDQSWSDMSWSDQAWASMSWSDQSWSDMSWSDMSWSDMSWSDLSSEDAAEGDASSSDVISPSELQAALTDPDLAVPVDPGVTALAPVVTVTTPSVSTPDTSTSTTDVSATTTSLTNTTATDPVPAPPALLP
jgi:serine protease AprX